MNRLIVFLLIATVATAGFSTSAKKRKTHRRKATPAVVQPAPTGFENVQGALGNEGIYQLPKYPPQYPGGTDGLMKFLSDNIQYPHEAEKKGIEGTVVVEFIIEKSGKISNTRVLKSVSRELDNEALRVVKEIKHFIPGYDEDHAAVRTTFTLPITFKLQ